MSSQSPNSSTSPDSSRGGRDQTAATVGVQALIDRLTKEGIHEGQQQAAALLAEAKQQASAIVDAARDEADTIVREAQHQAERTLTNGKRALALASRDANLQLKEQLEHEFRSWVGNLVRQQLDEPQFLAELIRDLATHLLNAMAPPTDGTDSNATPRSDQSTRLRWLVAEGQAAALEAFVHEQASEMLRGGVCLQADRWVAHGFRIQLAESGTEIDFSDEAVSAALMRFLAPKFRQLIGSVDDE